MVPRYYAHLAAAAAPRCAQSPAGATAVALKDVAAVAEAVDPLPGLGAAAAGEVERRGAVGGSVAELRAAVGPRWGRGRSAGAVSVGAMCRKRHYSRST